jgi:hypothetical protein
VHLFLAFSGAAQFAQVISHKLIDQVLSLAAAAAAVAAR